MEWCSRKHSFEAWCYPHWNCLFPHVKADNFVEKMSLHIKEKTFQIFSKAESFLKMFSRKLKKKNAGNVRNGIFLSKMETMSRNRNDCLCSPAVEIFPVAEFMAAWENSYLGRRAINTRKTRRDAKTVSSMLFKLFRNWKNPALFISCIDLVSCLLRKAEITHCFLEYECNTITL